MNYSFVFFLNSALLESDCNDAFSVSLAKRPSRA